MRHKQEDRVKLLFNQLQTLFVQLDQCVSLLETDTEDNWVQQKYFNKTHKCPIQEQKGLQTSIEEIKNLLDNSDDSPPRMYIISSKIKKLSTLPYELGVKTANGSNTASYYAKSEKIKIKCKNIDNDLKSSDNTSLENLKNTLIHCVRWVGRIIDNIVSIMFKENYNDLGETPFALRVVGKPQFFQKPILSVRDGINELEKVSGLLEGALLKLDPGLTFFDEGEAATL